MPIEERDRRIWFPNTNSDDKIVSAIHVNFNRIDYAVGSVVVVSIDSLEFGEILKIFIKNDLEIAVIQKITVLGKEKDLFAYEVEKTNINMIKNILDLPNISPCLKHEKNGKLFIVTKYKL